MNFSIAKPGLAYSIVLRFFLIISPCFNYFLFREEPWLVETIKFLYPLFASFFLILVSNRFKNKFMLGYLDLIIVLYFIYLILNTQSSVSHFKGSDSFFLVHCYLVLYLSFRYLYNNDKDPHTQVLLSGIIITTAVQSVWGLLQQLKILPTQNLNLGVQGSFINPGLYGCFMAVGVVVAVSSICFKKHSKPAFFLFFSILIITTTSLLLSHSRGAMISAFLGVIFLCYQKAYHSFPAFIKAKKTYTLVFITISIFLLLYILWQRNTESVDGRLLIWKVSFSIWAEHPITGIGYDNFFTFYNNHQSQYFRSGLASTAEMDLAGLTYYPFNEILKIFVEQGILGIVIILATVPVFLKMFHRIFLSNNWIKSTFLSIILTILTFAMASYPSQDVSITTIFILCLSIICSDQHLFLNFRLKTFYKFIFQLVVPGSIIVLCSFKIYSLIVWRKATKNVLLSEATALSLYERAYPLLKNNGSYLFNYGSELMEMKQTQKAIEVLERAKHFSTSIDLYTRLGLCYQALQDNSTAEKYFKHAYFMVPKMFQPAYDLLTFYQETQQFEKAGIVAKKICEKPIKIEGKKVREMKANACHIYTTLLKNNYLQ